jgi:hypothetical protein
VSGGTWWQCEWRINDGREEGCSLWLCAALPCRAGRRFLSAIKNPFVVCLGYTLLLRHAHAAGAHGRLRYMPCGSPGAQWLTSALAVANARRGGGRPRRGGRGFSARPLLDPALLPAPPALQHHSTSPAHITPRHWSTHHHLDCIRCGFDFGSRKYGFSQKSIFRKALKLCQPPGMTEEVVVKAYKWIYSGVASFS